MLRISIGSPNAPTVISYLRCPYGISYLRGMRTIRMGYSRKSCVVRCLVREGGTDLGVWFRPGYRVHGAGCGVEFRVQG